MGGKGQGARYKGWTCSHLQGKVEREGYEGFMKGLYWVSKGFIWIEKDLQALLYELC